MTDKYIGDHSDFFKKPDPEKEKALIEGIKEEETKVPEEEVTPEEAFEDLSDEDMDFLLKEIIPKARDNFYLFVQLMAPYILPEEFKDGRHLEIICNELQAVAESVENPKKTPIRLQLFLPPGSMKSKLSSNLFPAWCLGRNPQWSFLAVGTDETFAIDNFGRPTKEIIDLPQYRAIFPTTYLKRDVQSAGRWDTTKKGRFIARGAGQHLAGRRAHISICDDVISEQTSPTDMKKINNWYQKGLRTRLLPSGAEIIINTRWAMEDLSGYMLKIDAKSKRPWRVVSLPALLTEEASKILRKKGDPPELYAPGTSFWPELWPTEVFLEKKDTMPPNEWNALYMQTPMADEGEIIKKADWQIWHDDTPPKCETIIVSMDTAFSTKETADFSAYTVWGVFTNIEEDTQGTPIATKCLILLAYDKGRWEFGDLIQRAREVNEMYSPDFFIVEEKGSGISMLQELSKWGLPLTPYSPEGDKRKRMHLASVYFRQKRIFVPNKDWVKDVVDEVVTFPKAPHDDVADTVAQAILWVRDFSYIKNNPYDEDDEDNSYRQVGHANTYWGALTRSRL